MLTYWPLIPGFFGLPCTSPIPTPTFLQPLPLGGGRTQRLDLSTSPILLPCLSPSRGWQRPKKTERCPSSLSLSPSLPAPGKMVYSLPRPGSGPGLGVKFRQSFQNQRPCLGSSWTPHLSPCHLFRVFSPSTQGPVSQSPCSKILFSRWWKNPVEERFFWE